jgi:hypothetical protein
MVSEVPTTLSSLELLLVILALELTSICLSVTLSTECVSPLTLVNGVTHLFLDKFVNQIQ